MPTTALNYSGAVTPSTFAIAKEILAAVEAAGHKIHHIWGKGSSAEHATGRALDFMVYTRDAKGAATGIDSAAGDFIAEYVWAHRERLGLVHVLWRQRIRSTVVSPGVWRAMADRGSPTDNHMDHPHLLFDGTAYTAPASKPAAPAKPVSKPAVSKPAPALPAYPGLSRPSSRVSGATRAFQSRLKARGWVITVDGKHGPNTTAVIRAFQKQKGLKPDGIGGPATWAALWRAPITAA